MMKDLVCGMGVEEDDSEAIIKVVKGRKYYFCSVDCMLLFSKSPEEYQSVEPKNLALDVVCGMAVDTDNPPCTTLFEGQTFYFCSASCLIEFNASPKTFLEDNNV